jgi:hypothetical protein
MAPVTLGQRIYLGAVAALALWVGIWCYFIPTHSAEAIPWQVSILCATFLGSMYLSGAIFNATCMFARRWVDVRVIMPMIAMWTGGLTIISLFFLPLFDFTRPQVWVWFGAYIIYPLIGLWLTWTHRSQSHIYPLDEAALPEWPRRYLCIQGGLMIALGLSLLLFTRSMLFLWPWSTGGLMLKLYSAPLLTYGIGSLMFAQKNTWSEIRFGLLAIGVFTGAELGGSIFHHTLLDGSPISIALWFLWLTLTTAMLGYLSWLAFTRRVHAAVFDLATAREMKVTGTS